MSHLPRITVAAMAVADTGQLLQEHGCGRSADQFHSRVEEGIFGRHGRGAHLRDCPESVHDQLRLTGSVASIPAPRQHYRFVIFP